LALSLIVEAASQSISSDISIKNVELPFLIMKSLLGIPVLSLGLVAFLHVQRIAGTYAGKRQSTPQFSYVGATGPLNWDGLSPSFALCRTGSNQSPINIGAHPNPAF
jgi:hypothetical protein